MSPSPHKTFSKLLLNKNVSWNICCCEMSINFRIKYALLHKNRVGATNNQLKVLYE